MSIDFCSKMCKIFAIFALCLACGLAFSEFESEVQVVIDPEGNDFYLVPIELLDKVRMKRQIENSTESVKVRNKRQSANTTVSITSDGSSFVEHQQNILNNKGYSADAKLFSQRAPNGDLSHAAQVDVGYKPLDSRFSLAAAGEEVRATGSSTIYDKGGYKVEASGFLQKNSQDDILVRGGQLDLTHKRTDSKFTLSGMNARGLGSRLETSGTWNIYKTPDGKGSIGLSGSYGRTIGGGGGGRTRNCGALLHGQYTFG